MIHEVNSQEVNPVYRYLWFWLAIGYALIALVIYASLMTVLPEPVMPMRTFVKGVATEYLDRRSALWMYFDKWTHLFTYFVLMGWFAQIYHVKRQRIIYALAFIFMSIVLEFIQSFEGVRKLEVLDIVANTFGVIAALLVTKMPVFRNILLKVESYIRF
ncbi:MAG: VanZ family protein [Gammaproteobacteria bacterium]|nr:VanZ family protein [Gammaproteobacteria bacterium]